MTLTVKIGRVGTPSDECLESIDECPPESFDVCDPAFTIYPRRAYRSGLWDFFESYIPYLRRRVLTQPENTLLIKSFIDDVNRFTSNNHSYGNALDKDRMKWFKFWCNKAVELYGDDAGIEFC